MSRPSLSAPSTYLPPAAPHCGPIGIDATRMQSDSPPGLYQQWGGGQLTSQIKSGKVLDLTSSVSSWIGP